MAQSRKRSSAAVPMSAVRSIELSVPNPVRLVGRDPNVAGVGVRAPSRTSANARGMPFVHLSGAWLEAAGFPPGALFLVMAQVRGQLILEVLDEPPASRGRARRVAGGGASASRPSPRVRAIGASARRR